jgi:hypothetical protein
MSGSIIALPATTRGGLLSGLPTQRLKGRVGSRPHLIFSNCQPRLFPSAKAFSLVAKITKLPERRLIWLSHNGQLKMARHQVGRRQ